MLRLLVGIGRSRPAAWPRAQTRDERVALVHQLPCARAGRCGEPTAYSQKSGNAIVESQ